MIINEIKVFQFFWDIFIFNYKGIYSIQDIINNGRDMSESWLPQVMAPMTNFRIGNTTFWTWKNYM